MNNKKSLTKSILSSIGQGNNKNIKTIETNKYSQDTSDTTGVKLDMNSFVMVPTNHPRIEEIIKILNSSVKNENIIAIENNSKENNSKEIITLNEVKNNLYNNKIEINKNTIITSLAKDYIREKKIEVITTFE